MLYPLIRKFFFALDAEDRPRHRHARHGLPQRVTPCGLMARPVTPCPVEVMGLRFPNPVGLAAGLDKNGDHIDGLARLGFGFIEIGTITPRPQDGNPKPRLFRLPEAQGIINRMGFNNHGVDALLENVRAAEFPKRGGILGINIGKNFDDADRARRRRLPDLPRQGLQRRQLRHRQHLLAEHQEPARTAEGRSALDDLLGRN
jgi:dihydroorotate dehydrogenase